MQPFTHPKNRQRRGAMVRADEQKLGSGNNLAPPSNGALASAVYMRRTSVDSYDPASEESAAVTTRSQWGKLKWPA